jgi:hypothetical protein
VNKGRHVSAAAEDLSNNSEDDADASEHDEDPPTEQDKMEASQSDSNNQVRSYSTS